MTDAFGYSPVVRIPKQKELAHHVEDYLVSDTLFMNDLPATVRETDIKTLLQHCMPVEIHIRRPDAQDDEEESFLRFSDAKYADRAYTLFHQFKFTNGTPLLLRMYRDPTLDPEPLADMLDVHNLAPDTENAQRLFDVFRPYGPLYQCVAHGDGSASIQYFKQSHAEEAAYRTNGVLIDGNIITVTAPSGSSKDNQTQTPTLSPPSLSPPPSSHAEAKTPTQPVYVAPNSFNGTRQAPIPPPAVAAKQANKHTIDYMNLYVKNMDTRITNDLLHEIFGRYGRIISARVISHPVTKQSRGYGFVSFGTEDEAATALREINGRVIFDKPLLISYHEPKKSRYANANQQPQQQQQQQQQTPHANNAYQYQTNASVAPPQALAQQQQSLPPMIATQFAPNNGYANDQAMYQAPALSPIVKLPRKQSQDVTNIEQHVSSAMMEEMNPYKNMATIKLPKQKSTVVSTPDMPPTINIAASALIGGMAGIAPADVANITPNMNLLSQSPLPTPSVPANNKPPATLRRRGSLESINSIMTENTADVQRQRLTHAVQQLGYAAHVEDIVDLLLTLKRKERSLCLFNREFLEEKVTLAMEALDTFADDDDDEDENTAPSTTTSFLDNRVSQRVSVSSMRSNALKPAVAAAAPLGRSNPLQPAGAAPSVSSTASILDAPKSMSTDEIEALLVTMASLPPHSQKQRLGDIMWPHIKPLSKPLAKNVKVPGFSSKVLVHLLDHIPLNELAHGMNNEAWLKQKVEEAAKIVHAAS
ncbi:hypothetical protein BC940DRAFT_302684 [Gongronella butleri]|nr:hypothetical protein BC940DRAFT_302684 [Gongronella butleri]